MAKTASSDPNSGTINAAEYMRMSTEHQQYSIDNQHSAIRKYAETRNMRIVRTFADSGKSGLRIDGRVALKNLIQTIQDGSADFAVVLVYDISRWGRFQDADESAYYEYICRRSGIHVHYCAEQFENDGSPVSTIVKGVKRAMAGEYSRELSVKVFAGQCRLIELGFRQGGAAGYGLRRMLRDEHGNDKAILLPGERKSLQTDRVVLVPGPAEEVAVVRRIYDLFLNRRQTESAIAIELNRTIAEMPWTRGVVHQVLTNEKYIGNNVYNRVSFKLKKRRVKNPSEMWVRHDGAFEPIVTPEQFFVVRGIIQERSRKLTDEEMLARLKSLYSRKGCLTALIIDEIEGLPSSSAYRARFGSLIRAYGLVGFDPGRSFEFIEINRRLRRLHADTVREVKQQIAELGGRVEQGPSSDLLAINGEFTAVIVIARCRQTGAGAYRWHFLLDNGPTPDITLGVRMAADNISPLDYYLLPALDFPCLKILVRESNPVSIETYRFDNLAYLFSMARRVHLKDLA